MTQSQNSKECREQGCRAHAWTDGLCNYHALEHITEQRAARKAPAEKSRREIQQKAEKLGLQLDDRVALAHAMSRKKLRSPMA